MVNVFHQQRANPRLLHLNNRISCQTSPPAPVGNNVSVDLDAPAPPPNVAAFATRLAKPCHFVAVSCRFCHPERETSRCPSRQTGLNAAFEPMVRATRHQKAAKTAMFTTQVNIAIPPSPPSQPAQGQNEPRHACRGASERLQPSASPRLPPCRRRGGRGLHTRGRFELWQRERGSGDAEDRPGQ